jgi:hypothetical protein
MTMVMGPDFLCIGAQKAGTGWLYEQLRSHPDFWMPPLKELHYFDRHDRPKIASGRDRIAAARERARDDRDLRFLDAMEKLWTQPENDLQSYGRLFEQKKSLISGDITPGYSTLQDEIVAQIAGHFPKLKVIFLARDPVQRAWSQLSMYARRGLIDAFDMNDVDEVTRHLLRPEVAARSYPSKIVARWRRQIPLELFQVYFFDDLKRDPVEVRRAIISFLGGNPEKRSGELSADHNTKAAKKKLWLSNTMQRHLAKFFEQELKSCAAELGGVAADWPARYGF